MKYRIKVVEYAGGFRLYAVQALGLLWLTCKMRDWTRDYKWCKAIFMTEAHARQWIKEQRRIAPPRNPWHVERVHYISVCDEEASNG